MGIRIKKNLNGNAAADGGLFGEGSLTGVSTNAALQQVSSARERNLAIKNVSASVDLQKLPQQADSVFMTESVDANDLKTTRVKPKLNIDNSESQMPYQRRIDTTSYASQHQSLMTPHVGGLKPRFSKIHQSLFDGNNDGGQLVWDSPERMNMS